MDDLTEKNVYDIHGEVCAVRAIVERIEGDLKTRPCIEHGKDIAGLKVKSGVIGGLSGAAATGIAWLISHIK